MNGISGQRQEPMNLKSLLWAPLLLAMLIPGWAQSSGAQHHAIRLKPGQDLKKELTEFLLQNKLKACGVVTCVGSLTKANLRYANEPKGTVVEGPLEILTLQGCGGNGKWHLHLSVADQNGRMRGGHLLDGSLVRTTAEIVLVELNELDFQRVHDPETGYPELEIVESSRSEDCDAE